MCDSLVSLSGYKKAWSTWAAIVEFLHTRWTLSARLGYICAFVYSLCQHFWFFLMGCVSWWFVPGHRTNWWLSSLSKVRSNQLWQQFTKNPSWSEVLSSGPPAEDHGSYTWDLSHWNYFYDFNDPKAFHFTTLLRSFTGKALLWFLLALLGQLAYGGVNSTRVY